MPMPEQSKPSVEPETPGRKSHHGKGHTCGNCDPAPYVKMEGKKMDDVTFYAYAHVVCGECGYGQRTDIIKHGNSLTLGVPTRCNNPDCKKWRGEIKPGEYSKVRRE